MKLATSLALSSLLFTQITLAQDLFAESTKSTLNDAVAGGRVYRDYHHCFNCVRAQRLITH